MTGMDSKLLTLDFLWSSANKLKAQKGNALEVVQNQLRQKCLQYARNGPADVSAAISQTDVCRTCGNPWSEGNFKLRLLSHSFRMKQLKKKLITASPESLSNYQKHLLDLFSKRRDNVLEKTCNICQNKMKIGLSKPVVDKNEDISSVSLNDSTLKATLKRKKKPPKDKFSGLIPSAVISARMSQSLRGSSIGSDSASLCNMSITSVATEGVTTSDINHMPSLVNPLKRSSPSEDSMQTKKIKSSGTDQSELVDSSESHNNFLGSLNGSSAQDDSLTSNVSFLNESNVNEMKELSGTPFGKLKKKKKNKHLMMSNSYISFNDDSITSDDLFPLGSIAQSKAKLFSPASNTSGKESKSGQKPQESSKQLIKSHQMLPSASEIKNSKKKKKRSSIADFLKFL